MNDTYKPQEVEDEYYKIWEERGHFEVDESLPDDKIFTIMMPPPNVTGTLHIGHALTFTLQDIVVRYKRMDGYKTLWQPGLDHAGIATQNVVEKQVLQEGTTKEALGREAFLEKVWRWKQYSGGQIVHQMKKLGVTPSWERSRFTMDEGLQKAVKKAFVELYDKGFITKGNRIINWCTKDGALSDLEVEYEELDGKLYFFKYFLKDSDKEFITVATTRPETYFGDRALMVNPNDERYKAMIGKEVVLPLSGEVIPIIADEYVDMSFGTGVVKVTPAHDPNDYEVGQRHNLEPRLAYDEKGILNDYALEFKGQDRLQARKGIVERLEREGYIEKIVDYKHQVGHCYRCRSVVEPYISKQWFIKKEIAKSAIEKVNQKHLHFFPPHWLNSYNAWMNNLKDWCISRQLWWGHQIPVFYCKDCPCEVASEEAITQCPKCGSGSVYQDPDVLDTWFSSGLWPFSTLGWGQDPQEGNAKKLFQDDDLQKFYPNSLLVTGFDILFFWVARMIIMGEAFLKELPFKDVYLHALVRDETGQKMSKSKGNVIDPLDMIEEFSADIVRFSLAYLTVQGRDIKLGKKHLTIYRNFTNKLFNATKYLLMNQDAFDDMAAIEITTPLGRYIKSRFTKATKEVRDHLDAYRFNDMANVMYRFVWGEFCDVGIELSKGDKASIKELGAIFKEILKLITPVMPFISEHLYQKLNASSLEQSPSIMLQPYPKVNDDHIDDHIEKAFDAINDAIATIRRLKATLNYTGEMERVYIRFYTPIDEELCAGYIKKLAKVKEIIFTQEPIEKAFSDVSDFVQVFVSSEDFDVTPIKNKLSKQQEKLLKEQEKIAKMLNNEKFVQNAPQAVLDKNQSLLSDIEHKLLNINSELKRLS